MTHNRRAINEVRDIPAVLWIKVLSGLAVVTLALVGYWGDSMVDQQKATNKALHENAKAIIKIIGLFQVHDGKISRNTKDIIEVNVKVNGNSDRIYKLEGAK